MTCNGKNKTILRLVQHDGDKDEEDSEKEKESRKLLLKISLFEKKKIAEPVASSNSSIFYTTQSCDEEEDTEDDLTWPLRNYDILETSVANSEKILKNKNRAFAPGKKSTSISQIKVLAKKLQKNNSTETDSKILKKSSYSQTLPEMTSGITANISSYWQKSIGLQKYEEDYNQVSEALQINSKEILWNKKPNLLTVFKPNKSESTLGNSLEYNLDSINDLYETLNMSDFSEKVTLTRSDPVLKTGTKPYLVPVENYMQTEELLNFPVKISRDRLANGVFAVLSPSGKQIGSLIGISVPALQSPAKKQNRKLTKKYHQPIVIPSSKHVQSTGLQTERQNVFTSGFGQPEVYNIKPVKVNYVKIDNCNNFKHLDKSENTKNDKPEVKSISVSTAEKNPKNYPFKSCKLNLIYRQRSNNTNNNAPTSGLRKLPKNCNT